MVNGEVRGERTDIIRTRFDALQEFIDGLPESRRDAMAEALNAVGVSLEELQVAEEELRQQNEELYVTHQQLQAQRQRYQDLFEFAPDGYLITDTTGLIREANRAADELFEARAGSLINQPITSIVDENERPGFEMALAHLTRDGYVHEWNVKMCSLKGKRFDADIRVAPTLHIAPVHNSPDGVSSTGNPGELRWLVRDVTERSLAEERIRVSERQLAEAQQIAHVGSWHWDIVNNVVTWSDELYRIYGLTRDGRGLSYEDFLKRVHPLDRERVNETVTNAYRNRAPFMFDHRIVRPDGTVRIVHARGEVVADEKGNPVQMLGAGQDVTESRAAEQQIRQLNEQLEQRVAERTAQLQTANEDLKREVVERQQALAALRESEHALLTALERTRELYQISRLIALVRTPADVLHALTLSNYLRHINRAAILLFDQPWQDHTPEHCRALASWRGRSDLASIEGRIFPLAEYGFEKLFAHDQPVQIEDVQTHPEVNEKARDLFARLHTRSVILFPLVASGQWYGMLSLHAETPGLVGDEDVRHMRGLADQAAVAIYNIRLLEAEARARHEAEAANDLKLKFLAMISHELRTPLTSIKGFATTLLAPDVTWEQEAQHEFISTINQEADKLTEMIEQLLDLSRMQAGTLRINAQPLSFDNILSTAMAQLKTITRRHRFSLDIPSGLPPVQADRQRIAQVVTNLVDNAAKYSPAQSSITLSAHLVENRLEISVRDEGVGIPEQDRQSVFEVFRRGDGETTQRTKGAGLGLAICKHLIEAHGGRIWVQDHPGPGTLMMFTLPLASSN